MHATTLLSLLPALALAAPTTPSCTTFPYTVTNLKYRSGTTFSTPAHQIPGATLDFNLTTPYETSVADQSSSNPSPYFYGNFPQALYIPGTFDRTSTNATWSTSGYVLTLESNFTCDGQEYKATGKWDGDLNCQTTSYKNDNWTMGEIYSSETVDCEVVPRIDIEGTVVALEA